MSCRREETVKSCDHVIPELELAHSRSMEPLQVTLAQTCESLPDHLRVPMHGETMESARPAEVTDIALRCSWVSKHRQPAADVPWLLWRQGCILVVAEHQYGEEMPEPQR